ncbi:MAG: type IV pilin protein [Polyangiales bacterium]
MMNSFLRKREEGFTLVELMIVVAIIGVLAALAIYGVSRYLKHSKTAEATRNLGALETGSKSFYQLDTDTSGTGVGPFYHQFPGGAAVTNPASVPVASKTATAGTWTAPTWTGLKFVITEPCFYSYLYASTGTGTAAAYTAAAYGDLDGNSVQSSFVLLGTGSATGDAQRVSLTITNEDE